MLKQQLAKGNNGLVKSKYITFAIEAENIREAKPKLERIESDILNNFKILGVPAYPLNGVERLQILYETFNPDVMTDFQFDYGSMIRTGLNTKDYVAPTSFVFRDRNTFQMGNTIGAVSYLHTTGGIFEGINDDIKVARYHSLSADETALPDCLKITAKTDDGEIMAVEHKEYNVFGVQFHPESIMTPNGIDILRNFLEV